jgi:hypothetical protein
MSRAFEYFGQYQSLSGRYGRFPGWAKTIVAIFALPGLLLVALSIVALLVSILALLLLAAPVYLLLSRLTGGGATTIGIVSPMDAALGAEGSRRHVDVKVVE